MEGDKLICVPSEMIPTDAVENTYVAAFRNAQNDATPLVGAMPFAYWPMWWFTVLCS